MNDTPRSDRERRFYSELRRWGGRPPLTDPLPATRRVLAALPEPATPLRLRLLAATAVALLATFLALWRAGWQPHRSAPAGLMEPLPENVVLWYIEPETPVYFVLGPAAEGGGAS